ncbi:proline iminopeptidase Pip [Mycobacteroides abscessus subsp. abscessus]|uniref:3-oxoadipate enol-lactonase / 4-carboxymuconolactone decarboxylase n=1 Tax=Brevibacterium casei CIP 102111 TaxID=1255625 RepID=A0A2H1J3R0_9MICO|nr:4-carboxymuconolactone decarboxylase [Brevibacterium casei]QPR43537.1 4-carboxymuconolactone decarboxylase [Brevibacterium casei]SIH07617.1 proline iminopeptidase Pip [Mycobacteroides abscessus subsp. abscessus]SMX81852.1 3-oxoadipate enol-lactonase / 4-carboxymuconolactone decarboxylase [Brevibacterium casei CIP 102111]
MELTASVLTAPTTPAASVLVVLPSLGTSVGALWQTAAEEFARLTPDTAVVGIDLPGHGRSPAPDVPAGTVRAEVPTVTMTDLAEAVLATLDRVLPDVAAPEARVSLAGDSIGGALSLQLALDHPTRFERVAAFCTGAKIGEREGWEERAETVAISGTPTQVIGSAERWFAPGFMEREPEASAALLHSLQDADRFSYAALCFTLADFDIRDWLAEIALPVLAVAGSEDKPTPPPKLAEIASGVRESHLEVIEGAAHLVPIEAPALTATLLADFLSGRFSDAASVGGEADDAAGLPTESGPRDADRDEVWAAGMRVRREVLSDTRVDRANAAVTDFTADFQDLITRFAWGEIWTRPGLDRRMRSAITLTAMVAGGHEAELKMHVKAALRNGLSRDEIKEVLLQSAIYCSVPAANTAFAVASEALAEVDAEGLD